MKLLLSLGVVAIELLQPSSAVMFKNDVDKLLAGRFEYLPVCVFAETRPELCRIVSLVLIALTLRLYGMLELPPYFDPFKAFPPKPLLVVKFIV